MILTPVPFGTILVAPAGTAAITSNYSDFTWPGIKLHPGVALPGGDYLPVIHAYDHLSHNDETCNQ